MLYGDGEVGLLTVGTVSKLVIISLSSGKVFKLPTCFHIAIQIIFRLEQMHKKGFVHRDLKANNFMVSNKDNRRTIYIIDFGLSKRFLDIKTGKHIVRKGGKTLVGTARYASIASHDGF